MTEQIQPEIRQEVMTANYVILDMAEQTQSPPEAVRALSETTRAAYAAGGFALAHGYVSEAVERLYLQPTSSFELWNTLFAESRNEEARDEARKSAGVWLNPQESNLTRLDCGTPTLVSRMLSLAEAGDLALISFARRIIEDEDLGSATPHLLSRLYCVGEREVLPDALASIEEYLKQPHCNESALWSQYTAMTQAALAGSSTDALTILGAVNDPVESALITADLLEAGYTYFIHPLLHFISKRPPDMLTMSLERLLARRGVSSIAQKIGGRALHNLPHPHYDDYAQSDDLRALYEIDYPGTTRRMLHLARHADSLAPFFANLQAVGMQKEARDLALRRYALDPSVDAMHYVLHAGVLDIKIWRSLFDYYLGEARDIFTASQMASALAKGEYNRGN